MTKKKVSHRTIVTESPESDNDYKVGPGRPPKEHQWKPGQSGNPRGAKRKQPALASNLKTALQNALNKKITLKQGEEKRLATMASAGIEQLVAQYVKGDRHARHDLFWLAEKIGVDLVASGSDISDAKLPPDHEAILYAYIKRQYDIMEALPPVIAPADLLDDDVQD